MKMTNKIYFKDNVCVNYKLQIKRFKDYFIANGWKETNKVKEADLIFIGTCAAFDILENESLKDLEEVNKLGKKVIAYGCLTTFNRKGIDRIHNGVVIPAFRGKEVEKLIKNPKVRLKDIPLQTIFRCKEDYRIYDPNKRYVNICLGCPFNCTYCPHKLGIGELKSRPFDEIIEQIKGIPKNIKTITLVGSEVGAYGIDISSSYPKLLKAIMEIRPNIKIHISQLHPAWVLKYWDELLKIFSDARFTDIQILIQTISERLLSIMNRPKDTIKIIEFFKLIRKKNKQAVFRTDIMVGFPTETMRDLKETLEIITSIIDEITVYGFERKKGTKVESMGLEFHTPKEIQKRVDFAVKFIKNKGLLINRGGQVPIKEMIKADKQKHKLYMGG